MLVLLHLDLIRIVPDDLLVEDVDVVNGSEVAHEGFDVLLAGLPFVSVEAVHELAA